MKIPWLIAGLVIGYILFNKKVFIKTVKVGDKGKDIAELQGNINKFFQVEQIKSIGVYDKQTGKIASDIFKGTSGLIDPKKGEIKQQFLKDFNLIFNKL
jgi:hypothetical protein